MKYEVDFEGEEIATINVLKWKMKLMDKGNIMVVKKLSANKYEIGELEEIAE